MTKWWSDLSKREQYLIIIAVLMGAVVVVSLGVLRPLSNWQSDAARKASLARDGFALTASAAAMGSYVSQNERPDTPLRQAVLATAGNAGIEIVRIGTEQNGQLEIQVAPISGDTLFAWLSTLETQHNVSVAFADMSNAMEGIVNTQVMTFERQQ